MTLPSRTFFRAFGIVCCTSANVVFLSRGAMGYAFVTGFLISYLWWHNAKTAAGITLPPLLVRCAAAYSRFTNPLSSRNAAPLA